MRHRISLRGCVRPSVCPSVDPSVSPSVCPLVLNAFSQTPARRILCRVFGLVVFSSGHAYVYTSWPTATHTLNKSSAYTALIHAYTLLLKHTSCAAVAKSKDWWLVVLMIPVKTVAEPSLEMEILSFSNEYFARPIFFLSLVFARNMVWSAFLLSFDCRSPGSAINSSLRMNVMTECLYRRRI